MTKLMQFFVGGCFGLAVIIFIVWMLMRTDKEAINADIKQFDSDFALKQRAFAKTDKERKYWDARLKKLDGEITKAESQKAEAEKLERSAFDGLHQGLENHVNGLDKDLKSKEMEQLKKQLQKP